MKNIVCAFVVLISINLVGQESETTSKKKTQFGITVGYAGAYATSTLENFGSSSNYESGFSLGINLNAPLSKVFYLNPSLQYAYIDNEGFLFVPCMLKYYIGDKLYTLIGPQGSFSFGDKQGLSINTFGLDLSFGAGFEITDEFYIEARYAHELTNRTPYSVEVPTDEGFPIGFDPLRADLKTKLNSLHIILGYRF